MFFIGSCDYGTWSYRPVNTVYKPTLFHYETELDRNVGFYASPLESLGKLYLVQASSPFVC